MLYGTIRTTKVRDGKEWRCTETRTEFIQVDSEAEALTQFIAFMRDAVKYHYIEPVFKPMFDKGALYRISKEYSVLLDE